MEMFTLCLYTVLLEGFIVIMMLHLPDNNVFFIYIYKTDSATYFLENLTCYKKLGKSIISQNHFNEKQVRKIPTKKKQSFHKGP